MKYVGIVLLMGLINSEQVYQTR